MPLLKIVHLLTGGLWGKETYGWGWKRGSAEATWGGKEAERSRKGWRVNTVSKLTAVFLCCPWCTLTCLCLASVLVDCLRVKFLKANVGHSVNFYFLQCFVDLD